MILLLACALPDRSCDCPDGVEGFGAQREEQCLCLPRSCEAAERIDLSEPAGPDGVLFTEDDPLEAPRP